MWSKIFCMFWWCVLLSLMTNWFSFESTVLMALGYLIATMESEKINKRKTNGKRNK